MKRKAVSLILVLAVGMQLLSGCTKKVVAYPLESDSSETSEETTVPTHLSKTVESNSGKVLCNIEADVVYDMNIPYPMTEIKGKEYTDEDLVNLSKSLFDGGECVVLCPISCAGPDYLEFRKRQLEDRKNQLVQEQKDIPPYIDEEIKKIDVRGRDANSETSVEYTGEVKWYDNNRYFRTVGDKEDGELRFCYLEGQINGELFRVEIIDIMNDISIVGYKPQNVAESPDQFNLYKMNPDSPDVSINTAAESECNDILKRLGIQDYCEIGEVGAKVFGNMNIKGQTMRDDKAIVRYFAPEYGGRCRPLEFYNDSPEGITRHIPPEDEFPWLYTTFFPDDQGNVQTATTLGDIETGKYLLGYESTYVCMTEEGVISFAWFSPSEKVKTETDDAKLLEFDAVVNRIEDIFTTLYSVEPTIFGGNTPEISAIKLGMCRTTKDKDTYYMVPAWYIYFNDNYENLPMQYADYAVNAVDGSLIAVCVGGCEQDEKSVLYFPKYW